MKKLLLIVVVLAVGATALVLNNRATVTVRPAWKGKAVQSVPGSVTVLAEYNMSLKSAVGGRVVASELDSGAAFSEGDFLVQIDPSDLELEIERIQTEYDAAKSKIEVGSSIELELVTAKENLASPND
ncbi:MAG: hypothetical protein J6386_08845 [Candidatus Synoicihabitans palmerolidicus]|nr:hypothetical protein [Candidatus Synoicihabitans palmerolidicus]